MAFPGTVGYVTLSVPAKGLPLRQGEILRFAANDMPTASHFSPNGVPRRGITQNDITFLDTALAVPHPSCQIRTNVL